MKKFFVLFMIAAFVCSSLCACSSKTKPNNENSGTGQNSGGGQNPGNGQNPGIPQNISENITSKSGELRFLCSPDSDSACNTENGYYYMTGKAVKLRDGNYGTHLMYMDFATLQEIYLCSTAGCKHDSPDCPAVLLYDDFPTWTTKLFIFQDNLYILSREYDNDGSMLQETITIGGNTPESKPATLYRANLDGTERKKIYTFDAALTLEDIVIGNDNGIYVITKKLSADKTENLTYTTSSERKLMFLNLESLSIKEICPMTFDDNISWKVIGCYKNALVLSGIDFGREISKDEKWNDDVYIELYNNSSEVYALLEFNDSKPKEIYRLPNQHEHSVKILGDTLYSSSSENQNIEALNIETGERKTLCTLPQNLIMDSIGDTLCCQDWDLAGNHTYYFINTKTGDITHTPLTIRCNGWSIEFHAETSSDVLFVYDYDAQKYSDGSYDIFQYKHALISKDDLFAGLDSYRKIEMIGPGQ